MGAPRHVVILDAHLELTLGGESKPAFAGTVRRAELFARQTHPLPSQYLKVTFRGDESADVGTLLWDIFNSDRPSFVLRDESVGAAYAGRLILRRYSMKIVPYLPITFDVPGGAETV